MAVKAVKCLDNFYISELKINLKVKLCKVDTKTDPERLLTQKWATHFDVNIPTIPNYDYTERIKGIHNYNLDRIKELCNKEYFHGDINIEFFEVKKTVKDEGTNFALISRRDEGGLCCCEAEGGEQHVSEVRICGEDNA